MISVYDHIFQENQLFWDMQRRNEERREERIKSPAPKGIWTHNVFVCYDYFTDFKKDQNLNLKFPNLPFGQKSMHQNMPKKYPDCPIDETTAAVGSRSKLFEIFGFDLHCLFKCVQNQLKPAA